MTQNEQRILDAMRQTREPMTIKEIAERSGISDSGTRTCVNRLHRMGAIRRAVATKVNVRGYKQTMWEMA